MYGIFTNICPINDPNVGKYTIHGAYGISTTFTNRHVGVCHGRVETEDWFACPDGEAGRE
jgi:hypothetical protein